MILESLKNNKEREEIKEWIIQEVKEDAAFDKNKDDAIDKLLEKMEGKLKVYKWRKQTKYGKRY